VSVAAPDWLNVEEYPFESNWFEVDAGRMHYVDVGQGDAIVFVHGVPTWSFLFRKLLAGLRERYRCIAVDHLGFGLSDKPAGYGYEPASLQHNLELLLDSLGLGRFVLAVHDWGGPLGLPYAVHRRDAVRGIVLFNTWMWPVTGGRRAEALSSLLATRAYAVLDERYNATMRMLPQVVGTRARLAADVYAQYAAPLAQPGERVATLALLRAIRTSTPWLAVQWQQAAALRDVPALVCWGLRDPFFTARDLARWETLLRDREVHRYERVGHLPPEEIGEELCPMVNAFARSVLRERMS
jgi:haloalkane dehalogenase